MGNPTTFWVVLLQKLSEQRKSESWLARRLGVPVQTFASWKQRGQFRWDCLPALETHLGWSGLDVEKALQLGASLIQRTTEKNPVDVHATEKVLRHVNSDYRRLERSLLRFGQNAQRVLDTLEGNCFFAFSACTTSPYEFEATDEGTALAMSIARAISKGVLCLYIRPTEHAISYYRDTWAFGQLIYFENSVREFDAFRVRVRHWLKSGEGGVRKPENDAEVESWLHERLQQCYVDRSPMWMPGIGLSMLGWNYKRQLRARMTISLPGARFGGVLIYPSYLLLEYRFGRFLRKVVIDACQEIESLKRGTSEGQVNLNLSHHSSQLAYASRFYERFSHLMRSVNSYEPPRGALSDPHGPDFGSL